MLNEALPNIGHEQYSGDGLVSLLLKPAKDSVPQILSKILSSDRVDIITPVKYNDKLVVPWEIAFKTYPWMTRFLPNHYMHILIDRLVTERFWSKEDIPMMKGVFKCMFDKHIKKLHAINQSLSEFEDGPIDFYSYYEWYVKCDPLHSLLAALDAIKELKHFVRDVERGLRPKEQEENTVPNPYYTVLFLSEDSVLTPIS